MYPLNLFVRGFMLHRAHIKYSNRKQLRMNILFNSYAYLQILVDTDVFVIRSWL